MTESCRQLLLFFEGELRSGTLTFGLI